MIQEKFKSVGGSWLVVFPDNTRTSIEVSSYKHDDETWWSAERGGWVSSARTAHTAVCKVMHGIRAFAAFPPDWEQNVSAADFAESAAFQFGLEAMRLATEDACRDHGERVQRLNGKIASRYVAAMSGIVDAQNKLTEEMVAAIRGAKARLNQHAKRYGR